MAIGKVLDPTAMSTLDNASPGPDAGPLAGKRVGIRVDIIWRAWDWISDNWESKLREAGAEGSYWRSVGRSGEEGERQARDLNEWLKTIDIAIVGLANCGSCTGWTIRDAITAANTGIPTVAVATENFREFAHLLARRGGRSGLRIHVLPYPLNERERDTVEQVAEDYFDGLLKVLGADSGAKKDAA